MSKTPDPDSPAKLPELPAPPQNMAGRVRSDTFAQRKADARDVGIDTAFMDGLTSDLVLDGVPDHLRPEGAQPAETKAAAVDAEREAEAVDADALFDAPASSGSGAIPPAPPKAASDDVARAGGSVLAASVEERASAAKSGAIGDAAEPEGVSIPPPVSGATPKAAATTGSDAPLNPATLAIGGAILAIVLLLVFKTCAGSGEGEAGDRTAAAARSGAAAAEAGAAEGGGGGEGGAAEGRGGGGAAEGRGGGGAAEGGGGAAEGGGDAAQASAAQEEGGGDAADEGAEGGAQEDAADEQGQAEAGADETAGDAAVAEGGSEAGEVAIVDESEEAAEAGERSAGGKSGGGGGGPSAMPASSGETDPDRAAEAQMSAEELLAKAKESLKRKRYRDAYRQSTSSYHKKASDAALKVRVESACGMNNKGAAKSSFDKVSGMSDRRDLRSKCRDHGVRLGL